MIAARFGPSGFGLVARLPWDKIITMSNVSLSTAINTWVAQPLRRLCAYLGKRTEFKPTARFSATAAEYGRALNALRQLRFPWILLTASVALGSVILLVQTEFAWGALVFIAAIPVIPGIFLLSAKASSSSKRPVRIGGVCLGTLQLFIVFFLACQSILISAFEATTPSTPLKMLVYYDVIPFAPLALIPSILLSLLFARRRRPRGTFLFRGLCAVLLVTFIATVWTGLFESIKFEEFVQPYEREAEHSPDIFTLLLFVIPPFFIAVIAFIWSLGAAILLLANGSLEECFQTATATRRRVRIEGKGDFTSARKYALLLVAMLLFGWVEGNSQTRRLLLLAEARLYFSRLLLTQTVDDHWLLFDLYAETRPGATAQQLTRWVYGLESLTPKDQIGISNVSIRRIVYKDTHLIKNPLFELRFRDIVGRAWTNQVFLRTIRDKSPLLRIARTLGLPAVSGGGDEIFHQINTSLLRRQRLLPGLGTSFEAKSAVLLATISTLMFLVLLIEAIRRVLRSTDLGISEPWFLVDAIFWPSRLVASLWTCAIFAGPVVLNLVTVRMLMIENHTRGEISINDILVPFFTFGILPATLLASISASGGLLLLSDSRHEAYQAATRDEAAADA